MRLVVNDKNMLKCSSLKNFVVVIALMSFRNVNLFAIHDAYWSFSNWSRSILEIIRKSISDNDLRSRY
jgi:hypothetical protein